MVRLERGIRQVLQGSADGLGGDVVRAQNRRLVAALCRRHEGSGVPVFGPFGAVFGWVTCGPARSPRYALLFGFLFRTYLNRPTRIEWSRIGLVELSVSRPGPPLGW